MNIQQLKVLQEIGGGKTLAETAEKLGLKQPTVSFHLHKLEEELGLTLTRKTARKLRPTEAATDLLPYVRRIVALTAEMEERAAEHRDGTSVKLRLGASYTPATYFMPPYFAGFQKLYPQIQLQLSVKKAEAVLTMLRGYEIEAAIVSLPESREDDLTVVPLVTDELMLVFSPNHSLASKEQVQVEDLRGETFLLHEPGSTSRRLTEEWAEQAGLHFDFSMELGAIETMKEAVKCNIGIAVLPRRSVAREILTGELRQLELPGYVNRRRICLVYREEKTLSAAVRKFNQYMTSQVFG
ncbi:LysR family transcriptional regulator [Paenibacillus timonensis]|uniref:LysR family transcriptional regulator n=1 Tax=Paenibacillus timonensis TaxID=225915 RepID=A0ABW3SE77_9BACL|nr:MULTISPECIES: LysR family transcriptional regulator [Paenibacillus]MCH1641661.1 LysR family transcriptional regulator [Paenibacillus timonensis]MDU2239087.1 LysR family transcriptional regulator [Paenibacillus sp.]